MLPEVIEKLRFFNVHFLRQICVEKNILNRIQILFKSQSIIDNVKPTLVIRRGYLRTDWYNEKTRSAILRYLKNGQLRAITDEKSPFPSVIEIGNHISLGTNTILGNRILFMINNYNGHDVTKMPISIPWYKPTYWSIIANNELKNVSAIYQDEEFVCSNTFVQTAEIWSYLMPYQYYSERSPKLNVKIIKEGKI